MDMGSSVVQSPVLSLGDLGNLDEEEEIEGPEAKRQRTSYDDID